MNTAGRKSILGHLDELRSRLVISLVAWLIACGVVWPRATQLLDWLLRPLGVPAVFLGPAEALMVTLKVDMTAGAILASPVVLWQLARFVGPAISSRQRWWIGGIGVAALVPFLAGAWCAWRWLLPMVLKVLMGYAGESMRPQISADRYFEFAFWIVAGCGAAAEFPLITAGLARAGVIRARTLLRQWRYAVLGCSILGAMITPPEFGLHLAALFLLLSIYFLGVLTAALAGR